MNLYDATFKFFSCLVIGLIKIFMKIKAPQVLFITILFLLQTLFAEGQINTPNGKAISTATLDQFVKIQMDSLKMPGISLAVIVNGQIVYHNASGMANIESGTKVDDSTLFEVASLTKPAFAFFVMRLVDKGIINLDKPLYQYLPNAEIDYDDRYKLITARMVLSHTTGFPNWRADNKGAQLTIQFTPGSKYSYSGEGYEYLANVVAHITHTNLRDLETLYTKEVSNPLGLKHFYFTWNDFLQRHKATGYYGTNPQGLWRPVIFRSASSLQTEMMDYARFLIGVMDEKVLKKASINEMLKEQIIIPNGTPDTHEAFGLGFYMEPTPYGTRYSHNGSNGDFTSGFVFYKRQKFGYVFFTNCDKGGEFNKKLKAFLIAGK